MVIADRSLLTTDDRRTDCEISSVFLSVVVLSREPIFEKKLFAIPLRGALAGGKDGWQATERLVRPEGLEPPAYWFEASRSIQLSYGRVPTSVVQPARDEQPFARRLRTFQPITVLKSGFPRVTKHRRGPVAQLAEQQTLNLRVDGSIPSRLTTPAKALSAFFHSADSMVGCAWVADGRASSRRLTAFMVETSGTQCAYTRNVIDASR